MRCDFYQPFFLGAGFFLTGFLTGFLISFTNSANDDAAVAVCVDAVAAAKDDAAMLDLPRSDIELLIPISTPAPLVAASVDGTK